ncbi:Zonular occludens toxin (Zot) [Pseudomonas flavescens]|uniref:Zonular occludens toxin (Zot) n=1 Tax=Phytopseudomonas flavescens TaxID=29435 RepID=A0A1G7ZNF6_9GAMM|nr:zonular occludens toxin domain-containing protein [Pseudomonas flavescens]SDH10106.1 Zonular occludens toxin (Zot) [Pseudomonas flavescens]
MFVLRTGLQGNGKTLNTIIEVDALAAKQGRTVYYHNIREFNPAHPAIKATWVEFEKPQEWYDLPQNAVIVIDEAQTFFRIRPQAAAVPKYASALETMRHSGHELHCITQNPGLIDHHFRKLCNSHIHYVRGHKGKVIKRWEFERPNMEVEKKNTFADGESSRLLINKDYFGCYKSVADGSQHHFKFKPPRALFVLLGCILLFGVFGYRFYSNRIAPADAPEPKPSADAYVAAGQAVPSALPSQQNANRPLTTEEWLEQRQPRILDVPSSAPIYDQITQPVTYPKLSCLSSIDDDFVLRNRERFIVGVYKGRTTGCRCNTQQGTRYDVSFASCMSYVENGAFDPAKPDRQQQPIATAGSAPGLAEERGSTGVQPVERSVPPEIVSVGGGKPGLLW